MPSYTCNSGFDSRQPYSHSLPHSPSKWLPLLNTLPSIFHQTSDPKIRHTDTDGTAELHSDTQNPMPQTSNRHKPPLLSGARVQEGHKCSAKRGSQHLLGEVVVLIHGASLLHNSHKNHLTQCRLRAAAWVVGGTRLFSVISRHITEPHTLLAVAAACVRGAARAAASHRCCCRSRCQQHRQETLQVLILMRVSRRPRQQHRCCQHQ